MRDRRIRSHDSYENVLQQQYPTPNAYNRYFFERHNRHQYPRRFVVRPQSWSPQPVHLHKRFGIREKYRPRLFPYTLPSSATSAPTVLICCCCPKETSFFHSKTLQVNSALHPSGVAKSSTSFGWAKGGNVTSAGWQVTLCDPMWHVSSRSGVATLRTAIHLLLAYLLTCHLARDRTHHERQTFVCPYCLHPFSIEHCLQNHVPAPESSKHGVAQKEY